MIEHGSYPSKTAAILALQKRGLTERQIASRMGIKPNTVSSLASRGRKRARRICVISENLYLDLERHAEQRGLKAVDLASKLLTTIISDKLIDAVLG